jgi:hypothetical protein
MIFNRARGCGRVANITLTPNPKVPIKVQADITSSLPASVVLVSPNAASSVGCLSGPVQINAGKSSIETIRFDCVSLSNVLRASYNLAHTPVNRGEDRDDVWRKRFHILAHTAKSVVVNDSWCVKRLLEEASRIRNKYKQCEFERLMISNNGLCFMLNMMARRLNKTSITIYSAFDDYGDASAAANLLSKFVPNQTGRTSLFEIRTCSRSIYPDHDRFIKFNESILSLGSGLEIFDAKTTYKTHQFDFTVNNSTFRENETELSRECTASAAF